MEYFLQLHGNLPIGAYPVLAARGGGARVRGRLAARRALPAARLGPDAALALEIIGEAINDR
ncbi:hypothetical protein [Actinomadura macra]|uniref:hypothetical protein n=1 Tax=Actinomadura macra TaxID=46164 RepID=UPI00082C4B91|nr:hypothetical protein [Actinomadura macra]